MKIQGNPSWALFLHALRSKQTQNTSQIRARLGEEEKDHFWQVLIRFNKEIFWHSRQDIFPLLLIKSLAYKYKIRFRPKRHEKNPSPNIKP